MKLRDKSYSSTWRESLVLQRLKRKQNLKKKSTEKTGEDGSVGKGSDSEEEIGSEDEASKTTNTAVKETSPAKAAAAALSPPPAVVNIVRQDLLEKKNKEPLVIFFKWEMYIV